MRAGGALALTVAATVLGLGVGHFLRGREGPADRRSEERSAGWSEAERRLNALEAASAVAGDDALPRLEARVGALETSGPAAPPGAVDRGLDDLRTALTEIQRVEAAERRTDWLGRMLDRAAPDLSPDSRRDALARLEAFAKEVDALHPGGSAGAAASERAATADRVKAARAALETDLRRLVPADAVARILPQLPGR